MAALAVGLRDMRFALAALVALVGCAAPAQGILQADAPVGRVPTSPPILAEAVPDEAPADDTSIFGADPLVRCADPADIAASESALSGLNTEIATLDDGVTPKLTATVEQLKQLLTTKCFELAAADLTDPVAFDSGAALKHWWNEGEGYAGLASYFRYAQVVVVPEKPRPSLFLDGNAKSPLAPLLCLSSDATCGQSTAGWARRAERRLSHLDASPPEKDACATSIEDAEPKDRWSVFRGCRDSTVARHSILPLGRFKPPTDGFFVKVHGSRCHAVTIYDLATGGRATVSSCAMVNGRPYVSIGRVPVSALREAVWMLLLANVATSDHRPSQTLTIPADITPGRPRDQGHGESIGLGSIGYRSHHVTWSWFRANKQGAYVGQVSGEQWRGPSYDAQQHAADLLEIADDGFDDTCAPPLRRGAIHAIAWNQPGPTLDEPDSDIDTLWTQPDLAALQATVIAAKSPPTCTTPL